MINLNALKHSDSREDKAAVCAHCGLMSMTPLMWDSHAFCCAGCQQVFHLLRDQGLQRFYEIREQTGGVQVGQPSNLAGHDYSYVSSPEFQSQYVYGTHSRSMDVYVEGVHCAACLWLLEKLPLYVNGVKTARLNLGTQVLTLTGEPGIFAAALQQIQNWGYLPHPLKNSLDRQRFETLDHQRQLARLGVAAFCAGNIMLISVCLYAGVGGELRRYFTLVSFLLTLPVLLYSAVPLYVNSWVALRRKKISIDLPIVLAMAVAFAVSLKGLSDGGETYFDSVSALVFLISSSRFLLKQIQKKHLSTSRLQIFLDLPAVQKQIGNSFTLAPAESIQAGDQILVGQNALIPVDAEVISGAGFLNQSLLTGESLPVEIRLPQKVDMGARLVSGQVKIKALVDFSDSRIQRLMRDLESEERPIKALRLADQVGQAFMSFALVTAGVIMASWWNTDLREGAYRALSFMIVVCPCTFASVIPLVFSLALRKAGRRGIYIKDASLFERIQNARQIFFDKTGTLTLGVFEVLEFEWKMVETRKLISKLYALASRSEHPVSHAIARHLHDKNPVPIEDFVLSVEMLPSRGVQARFLDGSIMRIEKADNPNSASGPLPNVVQVTINGIHCARILLGDRPREKMREAVIAAKDMGYECWLISGDHLNAAKSAAASVGIEENHVHGDMRAEDKARLLESRPGAIMVGDGHNDALALQKSSIGIAVLGGVESALRSSHVYIANAQPNAIIEFLRLARLTRTLLFVALAISIFYNGIAGTLAVLGYVHPLLAAFIMPVNAMTVFVVCLWTFREGRD